MREEWKKELMIKYFIATYNFSYEEAENLIEEEFNGEITLDEEKIKWKILF